MLDWISSFANSLDGTLKTVFVLIATVVFIVLSARGHWAVPKVIISGLVAAGLITIVFNLKFFSDKVTQDVKSGAPAAVATFNPGS